MQTFNISAAFHLLPLRKLIGMLALLVCGLFISNSAAAITYDFPNNLPPGCTGSGGTYTCNIDSQMDYDVTFSDTGNVTINHNGDYRLGGGYSAGTASQSANVTINLVDPAGNTNLELYSGSNVYANFNVTTSSSSRDIEISMSGTAAVHGDINASSQDNVLFDMYDNSVVNGDVNTFGTDYASVKIRSNATVNGNVVADSNATDNGDIVFYDPGVTITGDVTAHGDITTSGTINGCVLITDTYSGARLTLNSGSSTANICKGTVGSCDSSSTYLTNNSGSTPPDCAVAAELIAEYHLDAESWDGTNNELKDTADYVTAPFDGQGIGSPLPSASDASPAHAGTTGTCGYANFSGWSDGSAFTLDNLPTNSNSNDKTSVSFWMYWDGSSQTKLVVGFDTYYLLFKDGDFGFGSADRDLYGISASGLANGWHHVVGVFSDSNVINSKLYIDGVLQTLTQRIGSPYNVRAQVTNLITVGGTGFTNEGRFDGGYIDEVKVYNGAVTQTQVTADFTATHKCLYPVPADNIAPSATLSSSNVLEGWDNINGVKDNITPTSSHYTYGGYDGDNPRVYANCCTHGAQDWLEFAWPTAKKLTDFQVFWWDEEFKGGSVAVPTSAFVEYWDGSAWVNVGEVGKARHQFNSLLLNNIITTKIRVTVQNSKIVGIIEVRILGEDAPELIAEYHLDEQSWDGTSGEVIDSSGNGYHATAAIKSGSTLPSTANTNPAYGSTVNGTCGYGKFTGTQYIDLPTTFPNITNSMTIAAWIKSSDINQIGQRIFADDQNNNGGYGFSLSDGGVSNVGKIKFFKRSNSTHTSVTTSAVIQNNNWYFVAVSVNAANNQATIYIYNQSGTLLDKVTQSINFLSFTDSGNASIANENVASSENKPFYGNIDELKIYSGALYQNEIESLLTQTRACPSYIVNVDASNFTCVSLEEPNTSAGHLYMQRRNNYFSIRVVALKSDGTPEADFSALSDKNVLLAFIDQANGNAAIEFRENNVNMTSKTLTFSSGNNTGYVQVDNLRITPAYRNLKCQITDINQSPALIAQSSDNFSVRPSDVTTVKSINANADPVNGISTTNTPTRAAGADFAMAASPGIFNYDGTFKIDHTKLVPHTGAVQVGTLTGTFSAANPTSWGWSQNNFQYSEVGYFKIAPYGVYDDDFTQVDISNGDCTNDFSNAAVGGKFGCKFANLADSEYFGRFTPDHFAITSSSSTPACGTFNYYGQDGVSTTFLLSAQNSSNAVTQNYSGAFAKLPLNAWSATTGFRFAAMGLTSGTLSSGSVAPTGSWSNGVASVTASHQIDRLASPMNPATVSITAQPIDSDGVTMSAVSLGSTIPFRYGRLNLKNAYGSEMRELTLPITAQYWDGTTYRKNTLDSCTNITITPPNITLSNYKKNLNDGETTLSGGGLMNQGQSTVTLSKPGAGNSGTVDLSFSLTNFPWMGTGNPAARATFGLYKSPIIYMRENF